MFTLTEKREYLNGEFMTHYKKVSFLIFVWLNCFWVPGFMTDVNYYLEDSIPDTVYISGIFRPEDNSYLNGTYNVDVLIFDESETVSASYTEVISISDNFFNFYLDVSDILIEIINQDDISYIEISVDDYYTTVLPFATTTYTIKSGYALEGQYSYDDDIFSLDYSNYRVGVGTSNPVAELAVIGTVNATEFYYGDGAGLYNFGYAGEDNYNYLDSSDSQFGATVTVNAEGDVIIGGTASDKAYADLQVYGSLILEQDLSRSDEMTSGAGSRFLWFPENNVIRIGYTPSYYWDDEYNGDNSIAFGYATMATGNYSIVTGGYYNFVLDDESIIVGGFDNNVTDELSIILGGEDNQVLSSQSLILGGRKNIALDSSVAFSDEI